MIHALFLPLRLRGSSGIQLGLVLPSPCILRQVHPPPRHLPRSGFRLSDLPRQYPSASPANGGSPLLDRAVTATQSPRIRAAIQI